jgi:hypothetical protein
MMKNKKIIDIPKEKPNIDMIPEKIIADNSDKFQNTVIEIKKEKIVGDVVDE